MNRIKFFNMLQSIFRKKKDLKPELKTSDIKLGEQCDAYLKYLSRILHFEPIFKEERNQIIFYNVIFEHLKFENFSYIMTEKNGINQVGQIILWSTYEEYEKALSKLHTIKNEICSEFKETSTAGNINNGLDSASCFEFNSNTIVSLCVRKIRECGFDGYSAELSFKLKEQ